MEKKKKKNGKDDTHAISPARARHPPEFGVAKGVGKNERMKERKKGQSAR